MDAVIKQVCESHTSTDGGQQVEKITTSTDGGCGLVTVSSPKFDEVSNIDTSTDGGSQVVDSTTSTDGGRVGELIYVAREHQSSERLPEAWSCYQEALRRWMQAKWIAHSGKRNSPIRDAFTLRYKLRSALILNRKQFRLVGPLLAQPYAPSRIQAASSN